MTCRHCIDATAAAAIASLTARQAQVLTLLCKGFRPLEISRLLHVGLATIHSHITRIHVKLEVDSRGEAIVMAVRGGLPL